MPDVHDKNDAVAGRDLEVLPDRVHRSADLDVGSRSMSVIDVSPIFSTDRRSRAWEAAVEQIAESIFNACRDTGFFYIANHGVPGDLIQQVLDANREFHARPDAEKMALKVNQWLRGYQPMASTQMRSSARFEPASAPNQLESFIVSDEVPPDHPHYKKRDFAGPNQWPDEPIFRKTVESYFDAMRSLAMRLLPVFSVAVGKAPAFFDRFFDPPHATLRLVHYPPSPADRPPDHMGIYPHTDYGFFTILAQDDVGGLEIQHINGTWVDAPPVADAFVVNIGDAMARWTNDAFNSSPHRVTNKSTERDRYSAALFFDPNHDTIIRCLEGFSDIGAQPKYAPIAFSDYYRERMNSNHPDRRPED